MVSVAGRIVPFLENAAIHCSVLSLLAISIERYIAICHPFRQRRRRSRFTGVAIILVCWAVSLLLCTPFLFMSELVEATYFDGKNYTVCSTKTHTTPVKVFIVADFVLCMLIPLVLLTVLYTAVIVRLKPSGESLGPQTATARKNRVPVVRMMVAVVALFYVCLLPMRSIIIWLVFESPENVERLGFSFYQNMLCVGRLLIQLNSAGNPIIYGLMSTKFRKAFKTSVPVCVSSNESDDDDACSVTVFDVDDDDRDND
nr:hypothetical protein BaRGS_018523 [Batillaria attramentaria]